MTAGCYRAADQRPLVGVFFPPFSMLPPRSQREPVDGRGRVVAPRALFPHQSQSNFRCSEQQRRVFRSETERSFQCCVSSLAYVLVHRVCVRVCPCVCLCAFSGRFLRHAGDFRWHRPRPCCPCVVRFVLLKVKCAGYLFAPPWLRSRIVLSASPSEFMYIHQAYYIFVQPTRDSSSAILSELP